MSTATQSKKSGEQPAYLKASKALGKTFLEVERIEDQIKNVRKKWKSTIDAAEAEVRESIQSDDDGSDKGARRKLNRVVTAFQFAEESEAGRKSEMSLLLEERKQLKSKLKTQVQGAEQLGLFD